MIHCTDSPDERRDAAAGDRQWREWPQRGIGRETPTIERLHEIGAKRHPTSWFLANQKAVGAMREVNCLMDEKHKRLIATVLLRVLDGIDAP